MTRATFDRRYALALLMAVYASNFADRQLFPMLMEPIRRDLRLTDGQMGVLSGVAFAIFYATIGVPVARLADRRRRVTIIAAATALWSVMTAACGLAGNFAQLALAQMGVGVGEGGCTPPAHSLIADYFPSERRPMALATYSLGVPLGSMLGLMAAGWVNQLWGWRAAFMAVGLPGLLLCALVVLTLKEPPRGMSDRGAASAAAVPSFWEASVLLWRTRSFRHLAIGTSLLAFGTYGIGLWFPTYILRRFGMTTGELSSWLGPLVGICSGAGVMLGGVLAGRLVPRDARWAMWIPAAAMVLCTPLSWLAVMASGQPFLAAALVLPTLLPLLHAGPVYATVQGVAGLRTRALAVSLLFLATNLVGMGLGPLVVGLLSDAFRTVDRAQSLKWALVIATFVYWWSAAHYLIAARTLKADLDRSNLE
jgi:predicted MFS family arabinose efflux permease